MAARVLSVVVLLAHVCGGALASPWLPIHRPAVWVEGFLDRMQLWQPCVATTWEHPDLGSLACHADNHPHEDLPAPGAHIQCTNMTGAVVLDATLPTAHLVEHMLGSHADAALYVLDMAVQSSFQAPQRRLVSLSPPGVVNWATAVPHSLWRQAGYHLAPGPDGSGAVAALGGRSFDDVRLWHWTAAGALTHVGTIPRDRRLAGVSVAAAEGSERIHAAAAMLNDWGALSLLAFDSSATPPLANLGSLLSRDWPLVSTHAGESPSYAALGMRARVTRTSWWDPTDSRNRALRPMGSVMATTLPMGGIALTEGHDNHLWVSSDAGVSWRTGSTLPSLPGVRQAMVGLADGRLMALYEGSPRVCVGEEDALTMLWAWRCSDEDGAAAEEQWQQFGAQRTVATAALPSASPARVVTLAMTSQPGDMQALLGTVATDGSVEWQLLSEFTATGWNVWNGGVLVVLADGTLVAVGRNDEASVLRSQDGGATWQVLAPRPAVSGTMVNVVGVGGTVVAFFRRVLPPTWRQVVLVRLESLDAGDTWVATEQSPIDGVLPATVLALDTGVVAGVAGNYFPNPGATNLVWWSEDLGATWAKAPDRWWTARAHHRAVFVHPGVGVVLAGGRAWNGQLLSDVWRSADEGATWQRVTDAAPWPGRADFALTVLPAGRLLVAGGATEAQPDGARDVWVSDDMGATWTALHQAAAFPPSPFADAVVLPNGTALLLLATRVCRSHDGGVAWELAAAQAPWSGAVSLSGTVRADGAAVVSARDPQGDASRVYVSHDAGVTWSVLTFETHGVALAAMPSFGVLAHYLQSYDVVRLSVDGGATWSSANTMATGFQTRAPAFVALPSGRLLVLGGEPLPHGNHASDEALTMGFVQLSAEYGFNAGGPQAVQAQQSSALGTTAAQYASHEDAAVLAIGAPAPAARLGDCLVERWDARQDQVWRGACRGVPIDVLQATARAALSQPHGRPDQLLLSLWRAAADGDEGELVRPSSELLLHDGSNRTMHAHDARLVALDASHVAAVVVRGAAAAAQEVVVVVVHTSGFVQGEVVVPLTSPGAAIGDVHVVHSGAGVHVSVLTQPRLPHMGAGGCQPVVLDVTNLLARTPPMPPAIQPPSCGNATHIMADRQCQCACAVNATAPAHCCLPPCMQQRALPATVLAAMDALFQPGTPVSDAALARAQDGLLRLSRAATVQVCFVAQQLQRPMALGVLFPAAAGAAREKVLLPDLQDCLRPGDCVTLDALQAGQAVGLFALPSGGAEAERLYSVAALNAAGQPRLLLAAEEAGVLGAGARERVVLVGLHDAHSRAVPDFTSAQLYIRVTAQDDQPGLPVLDDTHMLRTTLGHVVGRGEEFCPADPSPHPEPSHSVQSGGRTYALLDNTSPAELQLGCQRSRLRVPFGWSVAPPTPDTFRALTSVPWGAECVVLSNGWAYRPASGQRCVTQQPLLQDMAVDCVGVRRCARVLLVNATQAGGTGVVEPSFDDLRPLLTEQWMRWDAPGAAVDVVAESACGEEAGGGVRVRLGPGQQRAGAFLRILNPDLLRDGLVLSLWSRAEGVALPTGGGDAPAPEYGAYVDVEYEDGEHEFGLQAHFSLGTHDWEYREVTLRPRPGARPLSARLHVFLTGLTGTAWFSCVQHQRWDGNVLLNTGFAERASATQQEELLGWYSLSLQHRTYAISPHGLPRGAEDAASPMPRQQLGLLHSALSCEGVPHQAPGDMCGAQQFPQFSGAWLEGQDWDSVLLTACVRATGVQESAHPADFSVYADVWYADGSFDYGLHVPFPAGTFDWTCVARVFPLRGRVQQFVVGPLLRHRAAESVLFDHVRLVPFRRMPVTRAATFGDPHVLSAAAHGAVLQARAPGEYVLYEDEELRLHARCAAGVGPEAGARIVAVAALLKSARVHVHVGMTALLLDGLPFGLPHAGVDLALPLAGGAAMLSADADGVLRLTLAQGHAVEVRRLLSGMSVQLQAPRASAARAQGLLVSDGEDANLRGGTAEWEGAFLVASTSSVIPAALSDGAWESSPVEVDVGERCAALSSPALRHVCLLDGRTDADLPAEILRIEGELALAAESKVPARDDAAPQQHSGAMGAAAAPGVLAAVLTAVVLAVSM